MNTKVMKKNNKIKIADEKSKRMKITIYLFISNVNIID